MSIKECPFCGSTETHVIQASIGHDWSVECMTCETIGPSQDGADVAIVSWNEGSPRWKKFFEMKAALERIRDCEHPPLTKRDAWMSQIAREALE
jgi:Lar family restriction alleviation protein